MTFYLYKDARNEFRWRLLAANNRIIADSGEGYINKSDCLQIINTIKANVNSAQVVDNTI